MEASDTPFVGDEDERSLVRDALLGIIGGIIAFGLVTMLVVRIGWPEESWGFVVTIAAFTAPWAGVFFGSAAGIAYYQSHSKSHRFTGDEGDEIDNNGGSGTAITANA